MERVTLNNGELIRNMGLSVFDKKGKPIVAADLPTDVQISYQSSNEQVAQFVQDSSGSLLGTLTTEHDEVGTATITGTATWADGTIKTDALEVTVRNSAPDSVRFTVGVPESEDAGDGGNGGGGGGEGPPV